MRQRAGFLSKIIPAKTGSKNLRLKQTTGHDPLVFHGASRAEDLNRQVGKPFHFSYSLLTKIDSICAQISSSSLEKGFPGEKAFKERRGSRARIAGDRLPRSRKHVGCRSGDQMASLFSNDLDETLLS